ncbi:MAG: methionyl-tRNA formyltransferase [Bacteroidetes bacterium]|nr:methionyl-tRNA formyltransferase [Bacteroidota bacterium]
MNIIFFGTPDFAVASLKALKECGQNILAVVTAPDKPAGRGLQLQFSAVKKYALEQNVPVLQPEKLKDTAFVEQLRNLNADIHIVVAFRMLPEVVWNMPKFGTINLHASLLPQYRGAAPINWAIINGEKISGVTTFRLQHAIDTGGILLQEQVAIQPNETAGTLHDTLMNIGANLMVKTIEGIEAGTLTEYPQENLSDLKSAPKIFTETTRIDWSLRAAVLLNFIRGLSPYPAAFSTLNAKKLKIFSASMELEDHQLEVGTFITDNKTYLKFACADGFISIQEMQLEGKTKMKIADFLRGNKVL